jgi:Cft2 family RNA processing exonuclease
VLVDAGVDGVTDPYLLSRRLQELGTLDAVVVTHAHADHAGAVPVILAARPGVPMLATPATLALLRVVFSDALHILARRARPTAAPIAPTQQGLDAVLARGTPLPFDQPTILFSAADDTGDGWRLTLTRAGHVLGAAMVLLETPDGTVLVSGDVCRAPLATVKPALPPRNCGVDLLVLESTFGNHRYRPREREAARLLADVRGALASGGHVLIASSAVGIAQEILFILTTAKVERALAGEIWVDGSVREANAVYAAHAPAEQRALAQFIARHGNPFDPADGLVQAVASVTDRHAALAGPPMIMVSTSATVQEGPSAFYAHHLAQQEEHLILLPAQRARPAIVNALQVRCTVKGYDLVVHATRDELAKVATRVAAQRTVLVHGIPEARRMLAAKLVAAGLDCVVPHRDECVLRLRADKDVAPQTHTSPLLWG